MEGFRRKRGLLVLCYILLTQPVTSLRCYICTTLETEKCGDRFQILPSGPDVSNCPTGSRCVKFRGFRGSGVVKEPEVHRYCSSKYETNGCREIYRNGIDGQACVCSTNLCNSATPPTPMSRILLVILHSLLVIMLVR